MLFGAVAPTAAQEPAKLRIAELRLGFSGAYKLGCWTQAEVIIDGGAEPFTGLVEITARDPEGVTNSVITPPERAVAIVPGQRTSTRLFVRPGQDGAAIRVRIIDERGKERAKRNFYPGPEAGGEIIRYGLPATNRIVAAFGMKRGLSGLTAGGEEQRENLMATRAVTVETAADLPLEWYGYEAIDTLVLGSSQPELYRPLAAGRQRIDALAQWIELGGRLVIFCGDGAPELIGPDGPLAPLVPGAYDTMAPLRESQPIEAFANAEQAITTGRQFQMEVPKLTEVEGEILAFAGQDPTDLPLVVRARRGLGEITFVGVDPDSPQLSDWQGRANFLRQALQWPSEENAAAGQQEDLLDRVRRALDGSFVGVRTAPFALVALLVVLYILLIGPGDYFFVKRVLKRMELTWLTFPLIVFLVSAAAYWAAHYMKGDQLRVNQVEIVDVDLGTGLARGTVWTHFFSPRVDRYDLTLAPRFGDDEIEMPGEEAPPAIDEPYTPQRLVGWLGGTGYGLDGMQGRRANTGLFDRGYMFAPRLDAIIELPVQEWSTKTLIGRWSAELIEPIDARLQQLDDDLLAGQLTNRTGVELQDCVLMHGQWAYNLPNLEDGAVATIDEILQPTTVKTALAGADAGYRPNDSVVPGTRLDPNSTDVNRLTTAMMFHEALGGAAFSETPSRYQAFLDMSRLLRGDQAILFARAANPTGSQWTNGETSLASDQDRRWVYYRFVIPLAEGD